MNCIAQTIETLFKRENWNFRTIDERRYTLNFRGKNSSYNFFAVIGETHNTLCICAILPIQAPANKLDKVAELLHRTNYGLLIGNWGLDFNDGEINYKICVDFHDFQPSPDYIDNMINQVLVMVDHYFPDIGAVIFADKYIGDGVNNNAGGFTDNSVESVTNITTDINEMRKAIEEVGMYDTINEEKVHDRRSIRITTCGRYSRRAYADGNKIIVDLVENKGGYVLTDLGHAYEHLENIFEMEEPDVVKNITAATRFFGVELKQKMLGVELHSPEEYRQCRIRLERCISFLDAMQIFYAT